MKPKALLAALLLILARGLGAADSGQETATFVSAYNVQSGTYIYAITSEVKQGRGFIKTTGSSTTVNAVGTATPFDSIGIGDEITVVTGPDATPQVRYVTARASATSITINTAATWDNSGAGYAFYWKDFNSGTTATDGWLNVAGDSNKTVQLNLTTIGATSVDVSIEGRINGVSSVAIPLLTLNYTASGQGDLIMIPESIDALRVGWKINGAGTQSVSAYYSAHE